MTDLHFLIPKGVTVAITGSMVAASAMFSSGPTVIGVTAVVVAALVVVTAGMFTLRNNLKTFWKNLAEERGEQVKVLELRLEEKAQELVDAQKIHTEEMASFAEEQRDVRHELKTELASALAQLTLEKTKHDLTSVVSRIDTLEHTLEGRTPMFQRMAELLTEIRDQLKEAV